MEYLLILIADLLTGVIFVLNKKYQQYAGSGMLAGLRSNYVIGFFQTILFLVLTGFQPQFSLYSLGLASLIGLLGAAYTMIGLNILKDGKVAVYAMFLMAGGMLLPFLYGVVFSEEKISLLRFGGVLMILLAIVVTNFERVKPTKKQILLSVLVFFLNGILVTISNIHQKSEIASAVPTTSFILMANCAKCVLAFVISRLILLFGKRKRQEEKETTVKAKTGWIPLLLLIGTAAVDGTAFFCQVEGAASIPATVLYPLCSGGGIVMTALVGMLALKEKPTRAMIAGMVLCMTGMCMFL